MIHCESLLCVVEPMDMRRGADGLSTWLQEQLGRMPDSGTAFIFSNRKHTRIKIAVWDGNGVWLCVRRLHQGSFVWPRVGDSTFELSVTEWQWLVQGVDWQRLSTQLPDGWRL
jgi:transposase